MKLVYAAILFLAPAGAAAHGGETPPVRALERWTFDLEVTLPLLAAAALYWAGLARLWQRAGVGRGVRGWQAACFVAGWLSLAAALVSPLHWFGERLFLAHIGEHESLMGIAAPLLVLARPLAIMVWALPQNRRSGLAALTGSAPLRAIWRALTDPFVATTLHGVALWAWHAPLLFEAALRSEALHWLQHLSFLVTALFFWWALLLGRERERGYGPAIFHLFATALHSGFLGILLTFAGDPVYPGQSRASQFGLTLLEDQRLAGLIMWVPAGMFYAVAALVLAGNWIRSSGGRAFTVDGNTATR